MKAIGSAGFLICRSSNANSLGWRVSAELTTVITDISNTWLAPGYLSSSPLTPAMPGQVGEAKTRWPRVALPSAASAGDSSVDRAKTVSVSRKSRPMIASVGVLTLFAGCAALVHECHWLRAVHIARLESIELKAGPFDQRANWPVEMAAAADALPDRG